MLIRTAAACVVARVILSACSPYFRAMFTGELAESRATEVTIRDVDEQAMEQLVDFCYTAHIVVEESNVQVPIAAKLVETDGLPTDRIAVPNNYFMSGT